MHVAVQAALLTGSPPYEGAVTAGLATFEVCLQMDCAVSSSLAREWSQQSPLSVPGRLHIYNQKYCVADLVTTSQPKRMPTISHILDAVKKTQWEMILEQPRPPNEQGSGDGTRRIEVSAAPEVTPPRVHFFIAEKDNSWNTTQLSLVEGLHTAKRRSRGLEGLRYKFCGQKGPVATHPPREPLPFEISHFLHSPEPMDAFTIAAPVPLEETEQIPADYDTGNGTTNYSCTIA
ncbi:hypothetical protein POSPLADRAFT_1037386 [Postia placenta MAD-698-R-SB12]|uniref:Uncharacterized protein n=1 Tax=Postia placenta MAD-698-R-SB12 TaxID=670580 RepID=A0A1X6MJS0_9APHY|nr:hypothetical protein POSPLADRAFT_1037386 [Postia placenta MAD-698-R-SB12]OSX56691.1 hypothetical protein POSPLADRAFT_1037386 [Postia placenta MAD-698-R-SB12]